MLGRSTGNFKFLMSTGMKQDGTYTAGSEIINIETSTSVTCPPVPNFPKSVTGSTGVLIQKKIPLVCSGYPDRTTCYLLKNNAWVQTGNLNDSRYSGVMLPNSPFQDPTHQATIIGGYDTNTMEVFNGTSWSLMGPSLPVVYIAMMCAVYTNPTTIFIVAGNTEKYESSQDTYYFNSSEQKWVSGPKVLQARHAHTCGRIQRDQNGGKLSTLMAAGVYNMVNLDSVEILDDDSSTWRAGPKLPGALNGASMFEDPRGGLIVVGGGISPGVVSAISSNLYRLRHAGSNAQWETLAQKTQLMVMYSLAIPIPDEIALC